MKETSQRAELHCRSGHSTHVVALLVFLLALLVASLSSLLRWSCCGGARAAGRIWSQCAVRSSTQSRLTLVRRPEHQQLRADSVVSVYPREETGTRDAPGPAASAAPSP